MAMTSNNVNQRAKKKKMVERYRQATVSASRNKSDAACDNGAAKYQYEISGSMGLYEKAWRHGGGESVCVKKKSGMAASKMTRHGVMP